MFAYKFGVFSDGSLPNVGIPQGRFLKDFYYSSYALPRQSLEILILGVLFPTGRKITVASAFRFVPCEYSKNILPWKALKLRVNQFQWGCPTAFG